MKCIVYQTATGVQVTTPAPRTIELRAAAQQCDEIDRAIVDTVARLSSLGRAKSEAQADDRAALEARLAALQGQRAEATPKSDDEHIAEMANKLFAGFNFVICDKADLPTTGESTTDWTIVDGKVVLK